MFAFTLALHGCLAGPDLEFWRGGGHRGNQNVEVPINNNKFMF
jgi:hypothetical protein